MTESGKNVVERSPAAGVRYSTGKHECEIAKVLGSLFELDEAIDAYYRGYGLVMAGHDKI